MSSHIAPPSEQFRDLKLVDESDLLSPKRKTKTSPKRKEKEKMTVISTKNSRKMSDKLSQFEDKAHFYGIIHIN